MMKRTLSTLAAGTLIVAGSALGQSSEPVKAATSWADKVTIKGDVRFRYESIDAETKDVRDRERVRARLNAIAKPTSEIDVGIGVSTTEKNDPVSSNQTLTDAGSRKSSYFDLMFFDYHPELLPGFNLIAGKMPQPFIKVSDLVWDNDLNPEGVALKYKYGEQLRLLVNAAGYSLVEREKANETTMLGGQLALKYTAEGGSYAQAGASLFSYDNLEGSEFLFDPAKSKGNFSKKVVDGDKTNSVYASGFTTPEAFVEVMFNTQVPVTLYGSYIVNSDADEEDTGYVAGLKLGRAKNPGTWELDYNWRHLEANAAVGAFADSDSFGGGTDGEGHRISATYQINKALAGTVTYFINETKISQDETEDYNRLQVDLSAKF